jgi:hypothetical protein
MRRAFDVFVGVAVVTLMTIGLMRLGGVDIPLRAQILGGVLCGLAVEGVKAFYGHRRSPP